MPLKSIARKKYIFVSGGVISGIGKGTIAASVGFLLKQSGYKVSPLKFENYLNVDAGTINPIEHGDPFLCEDGAETDMDIGTYEKFLNEDMGKDNFVTLGQIYKSVIDRERRFEYNGEDVEAIPHITNEIIKRIEYLAEKSSSRIIIIELGGTTGEYQNVFYYEASRIMALNKKGDVLHIHVSYVPTPDHLGEPKTKPTQLSVRTLNSMGIQPDFIVVRCVKPLDQRRKDRLALFCNMQKEDVISSPDLPSVYGVPLALNAEGMDKRIMEKFSLPVKQPKLDQWKDLMKTIGKSKKEIEITIVGKYFGTGEYQLRDSYAALFDAIDHAAWKTGIKVKTRWVNAEALEKNSCDKLIGKTSGIIVPIGWGQRGAEGMIAAASYARERKIPYLGLCYGMQLAVVAFARDILKMDKADTTENNPKTAFPVIHLIPKQKEFMEKRAYGGTMRLGAWKAKVAKNTMAYDFYEKADGFIDKKKGLISERHRHRYEFNNKFTKNFEKHGFIFSARSIDENLVEMIELPKSMHPFYFAIQGHPEYKSRPLAAHPIFINFIQACADLK